MLIKFSRNRVLKLLVLFIVVLLLYIFPSKTEYNLKTKEVINENKYHTIFLVDRNKMIAKTNIVVNSIKKEDLIKELVEALIIDGKYENRIPNGFRSILPEETVINSVKIEENTAIIDFNDKLFTSEKYNDDEIISAIIYTVTSVNDINGIKISINGDLLEKLPRKGEFLEEVLTRNFGINKEYYIDNLKNIEGITIYYTGKFNDNTYYVPVTKYYNSDKDNKIKVIIEELSGRMSYNTNLISYLNSNAELLNYSFNQDEELDLNFNEYLFDNKEEEKVLEEVLYSIKYSIEDTMNIDKVNFYINDKEVKIRK